MPYYSFKVHVVSPFGQAVIYEVECHAPTLKEARQDMGWLIDHRHEGGKAVFVRGSASENCVIIDPKNPKYCGDGCDFRTSRDPTQDEKQYGLNMLVIYCRLFQKELEHNDRLKLLRCKKCLLEE